MSTTEPTVETAAQQLRRAADRVEQVSAKATSNVCPDWVSGAVRHIARNCDIDCYHDPAVQDDLDHAGWDRYSDAPWISLMDPRVAPLLAAWLRGEASALDVVARDFVDPTEQPAVQQMENISAHALAFARTILGTGL